MYAIPVPEMVGMIGSELAKENRGQQDFSVLNGSNTENNTVTGENITRQAHHLITDQATSCMSKGSDPSPRYAVPSVGVTIR